MSGGQQSATYDLSSSTALVTGAAGDIGRAVAIRLAESGARLALVDLPSAHGRLEESARLCAELAVANTVRTVTCDVRDTTEVEACVASVTSELGPPDLVFNNAGYQGEFVGAPDYPVNDARLVMETNVIGVFNVLRASARQLRTAAKSGSIVNTASMAGVSGAPNMIAYSASKGAVISLTRAAALDLAPLGIRVNAVSPAFIGPGAMWTRQVELQARTGGLYYESDPDRVAEQMVNQVPMRRLGTVDEVASSVVWLLSDESSYITGENMIITGGIV